MLSKSQKIHHNMTNEAAVPREATSHPRVPKLTQASTRSHQGDVLTPPSFGFLHQHTAATASAQYGYDSVENAEEQDAPLLKPHPCCDPEARPVVPQVSSRHSQSLHAPRSHCSMAMVPPVGPEPRGHSLPADLVHSISQTQASAGCSTQGLLEATKNV